MTHKNLFGVAVRTVGLLAILIAGKGLFELVWLTMLTELGLYDEAFWLVAVPNSLGFLVGLHLLRKADEIVAYAYPIGREELEQPSSTLTPNLAAGRSFVSELQADDKRIPKQGRVFIHMGSVHQLWILKHAEYLRSLGYELVSTEDTLRTFNQQLLPCTTIGDLPSKPATVQSAIANGEIQIVMLSSHQEDKVAKAAAANGVLCATSRTAISKVIDGIAALHSSDLDES